MFNTLNTSSQVIIIGFIIVLLGLVFNYSFKLIETAYVVKYRKPFFNHFYIILKQLNANDRNFLKNSFKFYSRLSFKEQKYFEHRLIRFKNDKDFLGREGVEVTEEMKILISATAAMLTFGFREYLIPSIERIVVYPDVFFSTTNQTYNKGEFNPSLKSLVLSWKDFKKGYAIQDDNINLGIHEFTHAIQINSIQSRDVSSIIFSDTFAELSKLLHSEEYLKSSLVKSKYFRDYAYTNQFEFLAVALETFIETPSEFKSQFPEIYYKIRQMLNFEVAGY